MTCNTQHPKLFPLDQIQKIEWDLRSEFSYPIADPDLPHSQGIMTTKIPDLLHNPKDTRWRGRWTNMELLKQVKVLLNNSGQIRPIDGFFPSNP